MKRRLRRPRKQIGELSRWHVRPLSRDVRKAVQLSWAVEKTNHLSGDVVECGVGAGSSLSLLAQMLNGNHRRLHAVDTFSGFPVGTTSDSPRFSPKRQWSVYEHFDIDFVRTQMLRAGVSPQSISDVVFHVGNVAEVLPVHSSPISLLHLDLDLYASYLDALSISWPKVQATGLELIDEYDTAADLEKWPGANAAINQFCQTHGLGVSRHWTRFCYLEKE